LVIAAMGVGVGLPALAAADGELLGKVHFATSCNEVAQRRFDRAIRYQHSFWYRESKEIFEITSCLTTERPSDNVVSIALTDPMRFDPAKLSRHVFSSSSCGICGKATIEAVMLQFPSIETAPTIESQVIFQLPGKLAAAQETFQRTGGLHACALFDASGELLLLREDVGRHNALDKLIGHQLLAKRLPLGECILLLSGRVSFEMAQKALAAGLAIIAAISAPTSLAVEFAQANNQTLIGFLRGESMNIYTGAARIRP